MLKRLLLTSAMLLPTLAHADESIPFPTCVSGERLRNTCADNFAFDHTVHLSPAEWAQMQQLSEQAYDILIRAAERKERSQSAR